MIFRRAFAGGRLFGGRAQDHPPAIDLASPEALADPYSAYERLRARGPVAYLPKQGFWLVLGHEEMRFALTRPDLFSNRPYTFLDPYLLAADPPAHGAIRAVVMKEFTSAKLAFVEDRVRAAAEERITASFEVAEEFALPIAYAAGAAMTGLSNDELPALVEAATAARRRPDYFPALLLILDALVPKTEVYRRLESESGAFVDPGVRASVARILWLASTTAIEREITRSLLEMVKDQSLQTQLRDDPARLKPFVEEIMRLYPPEHMVPRVTLAPVEIGGVTIPAGQSVWLCTTAANRDPAKFERPSELVLERGPNSHVSFGAGPHVCSGAALTRRLIPAVLAILLSRTVRIEAARPLEDVPYLRTVQTTSPLTLHVQAEPAVSANRRALEP